MTIHIPLNIWQRGAAATVCVVCDGSGGAGKSTIAQMLASSFNMPNVLQTDIFHEVGPLSPAHSFCQSCPCWVAQSCFVSSSCWCPFSSSCSDASTLPWCWLARQPCAQLLRASTGVPLQEGQWGAAAGQLPLHCGGSDLIDSYQQECRLVRKALDGDLVKVRHLSYCTLHFASRHLTCLAELGMSTTLQTAAIRPCCACQISCWRAAYLACWVHGSGQLGAHQPAWNAPMCC